MAGIYGKSKEDRYFEGMLYRHLDGQEDELDEEYLQWSEELEEEEDGEDNSI